ncbi:hypothetical protein QQF64_006501 [Cirrhinus molitorella]|uniref:Uncharacterized protein n=1 Tax=Cirrhinus molitorella TaxID=172907 RepID=A0ABR3MAE1_9TELE
MSAGYEEYTVPLTTSYKKFSLQHTDISWAEETCTLWRRHSQTSKRDYLGRGKPRGRQGGRHQAPAPDWHFLPEDEGRGEPTPDVVWMVANLVVVGRMEGNFSYDTYGQPNRRVPLTVPSRKLNIQEEFENNMERLSDILSSYPSAEPQRSSASSWSFRQQKASDRWKETRPYHLKCLIAKEAIGRPLCRLCHEPAVIRCIECLPEEWFCGDCVTKNSHSTTGHVSFMGFLKPFLQPCTSLKGKMGIAFMSKLAFCRL